MAGLGPGFTPCIVWGEGCTGWGFIGITLPGLGDGTYKHTFIDSSHDLACFKCYITIYHIPIKIFPRIQAVPSSGKYMSRADFMFHYSFSYQIHTNNHVCLACKLQEYAEKMLIYF